jgi:eukaryotic-like serine/threonine-protein kinase
MADAKSAPSVGELVAVNYQILGTAGAGGMGVVYRALDLKLQRTVALKFLPPDLNASEREKARFLKEARTASSLDHPNIGVIYGIEETPDDRTFIAMAYYEGQSLAQRIRTGPLPPAEAADIAIQVLRGLEHAHLQGVEHRDVKPSNVMLTRQGPSGLVVKLVDFGLAHVSQQTASQTHSLSGTVAYMSPEQTLGRQVDSRSDIWATGVVLLEMLSGRNPFGRDTIPATIFAILNEAPQVPEAAPIELLQIVYRALSKDPVRRYQSCSEMLASLEAIRPGLPEASSADSDSRRDLKSDSRGDSRHDSKTSSRVRELELRRSRENASASAWGMSPPKPSWKPWAIGLGAPLLLLALILLIPSIRARVVGWFAPSGQGAGASGKSAAYEGYLAALGFMDRYDKPGNLDRAISALQGSLQADPLFALSYAELGEAYRMKYQTDRNPKWLELALSNCQRAEELDNRIPAVYVTLAEIHSNQGKQDLAYQELQQALDINPRDPAAIRGMAHADAAAGKLKEAEDGFRRAMALRPDDWSGPNELGLFYAGNGKYRQAIDAYKKAVALSPDNAFALSNLGSAYLSLGDKDSLRLAQDALEKSLAIQSNYEAYSNLGVLYLEQKHYPDSAAMTRKALEIDDKDYLVWENLRTACEWTQDSACEESAVSRELPLLERLVQVRSQDGLIRASLAILYAKRGETEKAEKQIQSALAFGPDAPDTLESVAAAYASLGDHQKATLYLKQAIAKGEAQDVIETDADLKGLPRTADVLPHKK